ncbi:hypothetical protein AAHC03_020774 [Spirometra sp. Aus1]
MGLPECDASGRPPLDSYCPRLLFIPADPDFTPPRILVLLPPFIVYLLRTCVFIGQTTVCNLHTVLATGPLPFFALAAVLPPPSF